MKYWIHMESHTFALLAKSLVALNMVFSVHYGDFWITLLMNKWTNCCHAWWSSSIHLPNPYLLLSATCDEMLSRMIEIWVKKNPVSDNNCNTVIFQIVSKEWQTMLG
jgi:hypothetical protein